MRYVGVILAILAVLVSGCSQSKAFTFQEVTYSLSGGIGGLDMQILIMSDGSYQATERGKPVKSGTLSGEEMQRLKQELASVDWSTIAPSYTNPKVADAMLEAIHLRGVGSRDYETVVGTGGAAPADLISLMAHLQQILKEHRA